MSDHADTIRQALQGAMVGQWGRENALRALDALESENQRLRDALADIASLYEKPSVFQKAADIARAALDRSPRKSGEPHG